MKYSFKFFSAFLLGIILLAGNISVAGQQGIPKGKGNRSNLTEQQKLILEANRASIAETRNTFKSSMTPEQLAIVQDNTLSIEQKRASLRASLSPDQQQILNQNRQMRQSQRQSFRNSLTMQQKQYMKKAFLGRVKRMESRPGLRRRPLLRRR